MAFDPRVAKRLPKIKQDQLNNGIASIVEARFKKRIRKAEEAMAEVEIQLDTPEISTAIRDARQSLVKRPWWSDLTEETQDALLESSDRLQRGQISSVEWSRLVSEAQAVARGPVPANPPRHAPYRNVNITIMPWGF